MKGTGRNYKDLERIVKGFANHRRIMIIDLLQKQTELTLDELAEQLKINFRTASEHLRRLTLAGLVSKRYKGRFVLHKLTPLAADILTFLGKLE